MTRQDTVTAMVVKRGIRRGITTLLREREWGSALGALFGVFLLVQLLLTTLVGAQGIQSLLRERTDVRLEVRQSAEKQDVLTFFSVLQQKEYIEDTAYITKEQAYERARTHDPELIAFIEEFGMGNPFPDTIGITLHSLDDYALFRSFIEQPEWNAVVDPSFLSEVTNQEKQIGELLRVTKAGRDLATVILALVAGVLLFITTELVRRRVLSRANEVLVEKLVGSSPLGMFVPFATEACLLLLFSIGLSMIVMTLLLLSFPLLVPALKAGGILSVLHAKIASQTGALLPGYFFLELLIIPAVAAAGTWIGMRQELGARSLSLHTN